MIRPFPGTALPCLLLAPPVLAQTSHAVVPATRSPPPLADCPASVSVVAARTASRHDNDQTFRTWRVTGARAGLPHTRASVELSAFRGVLRSASLGANWHRVSDRSLR